jgi:hypothetical protein
MALVFLVNNLGYNVSHFSVFGDFSMNFETVYFIARPDYNIYMDAQQKIYLELLPAFEKRKKLNLHIQRRVCLQGMHL